MPDPVSPHPSIVSESRRGSFDLYSNSSLQGSEQIIKTQKSEVVAPAPSMGDVLLIIGMMLAAGCLGGIVTSSLARKEEDIDAHPYVKNMAIGVGAAFLVPLFLKSVDSNILAGALSSISNGLVFFGYCVLAAISARHFITTLTDQIFKTVDRLKKETAETKAALADTQDDVKKNKVETNAAKTAADDAKTVALAASDAARHQTVDLMSKPVTQRSPPTALQLSQQELDDILKQDDPWKGRFGREAVAKERELEGSLTPIDGQPSLAAITLTVRSTNVAKPLVDPVQFFLHPTFQNYCPEITSTDGRTATLRIISYGAFTVGVLCDGGQTKLELDLASLPEAWEPWKSR